MPPGLTPAVHLADRLSEFPPVGGNALMLLPHYDAAIDRIIAEIAGARRFVHMLFYIFENDEVGAKVTDALVAAAQRGVSVRVLMDAVGSRAGLAHLGPRMRAAGAEVIAVMPLRLWGPNAVRFDLRNHRKIVVVDDTCAFFGSQNIVSAHANRGLVNEELLVRATGPDRASPARGAAGRPLPRDGHAAARVRRPVTRGPARRDRRLRAGRAERPRLQRGHARSR